MKMVRKRLLSFVLVAAMTVTTAGPASAARGTSGNVSAPWAETNIPEKQWQIEMTFPDAYGYVDDTLAMNSLASFTNFRGQGELYVTVASGVTSFRLFVNNAEVNTASMSAGSSYKLDITDLAVDGTNTVQVTNIRPADLAGAITVRAAYPEVIESAAADVGMDAEIADLIGDYINAEVKYGFSGAQLAVVKDGKLVVNEAYGLANGYHADGTRMKEGDEGYVPVTTDTLYDLASNTKMYSVNYALQYMLSNEGYQIALDDPITKFFPEFDAAGKTIFKEGTTEEQKAQIITWKSQLTIRDILMHQAGFDPDPQYHNDKFNQATQKPDPDVDNPLFSQDRETTLSKVLASPLTYAPGSKTVYSDVDYMLLCFIIEKVTGKGMDEFLKETFWEPMGLTHMTYNPLENGFTKEDCAATELQGNTRGEAAHGQAILFENVRTETVWGEVHDEKAYYAMDGISGHAGLFSNAEDLAKLASVMLSGGYGGSKFFEKNVIDEFIKPNSAASPAWGLGWWRQGELGRAGFFSTQSSNATIGHQGWTGTLTVIDPEENLVVVLLTNKKNSPVLDNTKAPNDFYSDNMVLGALGGVVGMVYDALRSSPDALDSTLLQMAHDRIRLMTSHKGAYDEAPHMNDPFAMVDLVISRAEKRKSEVTKANAALALKNLNDFVKLYVVNQANLDNAAAWAADMQTRIDAIETNGSAPAAPGLSAVPTTNSPLFNDDTFIGGDMNAVFFPRPYSASGGVSYAYYNTGTWFDGYEGQGVLYLQLKHELTVDGGIRLFVNGVEVDNTDLIGKTGIFAIDVSGVARNGRNSIHLSIPNINETKRDTLIAIANPTVVSGTPEEVGIDGKALDMIDAIIQSDVDNGFTSAQLAVVKDGKLVYSDAWGTVNAYHPDGTPKVNSPAVTTDTLYDLASNTKMYAANYAVQYLVQQKKLALTDPITKFLPAFASDTIEINYNVSQGTGAPDLNTAKLWKSQLTIQDILQHQAGFAPDPQFHNDKFNQVTQKPDQNTGNVLYAIGKEQVKSAICKAPLVYQPGTKTVYSDVDYMLLGLIIEQITGKDLDTFMKETFYTPLGLDHITFNPLDHGFVADEIAATELNGNSRDGVIDFTGIREGTIQGTVHDEKAYYAMGGVSGHAGLFSNAEDLAKLAQMMLNPTGYGTNRLFGANVNEYFTSRNDSSATWGQGWWRQGDCGRPWYFGVQASRGTIGHQGWTGTLTMIDPAEDLVVVYLTNKINSPVTDNTVSPNQFDGNWYTASTLGFVANILNQGLVNNSATTDIQPALDALMGDMAIEKMRLVDDEGAITATHPIVKSAYALSDLVFDVAEARPTAQNISNAEAVIASLDAVRDAEKIRSLKARLGIWTVTFQTAQGSEQVDVKNGERVSDPRNFIGWYQGKAAKFFADSAYTELWDFNSNVITQNTTIYVQLTEEVPGDRLVRVMTYNMRYGHNDDSITPGGDYDLQSIADVIIASEADVVCLQEVDVNWGERSNYEDTLAILAEKTGMHSFNAYIYDVPSKRGDEYPNEQFGVAFLSKYPIEYSANHEITRWSTQPGDPQPGDPGFPGLKPGFGEIVVNIDGLKVVAYNTHLDYRGNAPDGCDKTIRYYQAMDMMEIMDTGKYPAILAGDMNAEVKTESAREDVFDAFLTIFKDVWAEKGIGEGNSYPAGVPNKRIDYILTSPDTIDVVNAFQMNTQASDHRPVIADLLIHGEAQERTISVSGGSANLAQAARGTQVTITAVEDAYRTFTDWTVQSGGVTLADENQKVTTFTMGDEPVSIKANFITSSPPDSGATTDTTTTTKKNSDGSTTVTATNKRTGTVTATTTYPDGTKIIATTPKGGETDIEVTVPSGKNSVTVTIPTEKKPKPGEVAVIVKNDGTREIVKTSVATEAGLRVTLIGSAKLEIMDNSKTFTDVPANHWANAAVQFVTSRELFNGTGGDNFSPTGNMTRGMLMTVLARLAGWDTTKGETWFSAGMEWAKELGVSDGTAPEADITRESLVVMLYRYAKAEKADGMALSEFPDAEKVSVWAEDAMGWAVANGIFTGNGAGELNPGGTASRAEVATMLMRFVQNMIK